MKQPAAAFLWQHRVQGRAVLPGAAMMESCFAAAAMLIGDHFLGQRICMAPGFRLIQEEVSSICFMCWADERLHVRLCLTSLAIPAPLILPGPASASAPTGSNGLQCCIGFNGSAELQSTSARQDLHLMWPAAYGLSIFRPR